jgi:hypothetical protein
VFDDGNGADGKDRCQSDHCENTGAHDLSGLAIPAPPVRLNACDGLNPAAWFQALVHHENSKWAKGFYG